MPSDKRYIAAQPLQAFVTGVFGAVGLSEEDAGIVARSLVKSDLRGVHSHGVARAPHYVRRFQRGAIKTHPDIQITNVTPAASLVDGDNGSGFVVGTQAMAEAIRLARHSGVGLVGIKLSTHYGMAATYILQALEAGLISFAFSNASPGMAPWGGFRPFFGTNPYAVGIPGGHKHVDYLLDMATSAFARGKIRIAAAKGEAIPEGWALDTEGRSTTDPEAALKGVMLPLGTYKGSGIAMQMDLLGGLFTGAAFGGMVASHYDDWDRPQDTGHLFLAIRPDLFMPMEVFRSRMETFVENLKAQPRALGIEEILVPGEPELRREATYRRTGIPLNPPAVKGLRDLADELDVPMSEVSADPLG